MEQLDQMNFYDTTDVTGHLGLQKIFQRGRFTNKITEYVRQTSVRLSVQGLASFLYKTPKRIMFLCGEFFVRGIGGKISHVRMSSNHSLPVQWSEGISIEFFPAQVDVDRQTCTCGRKWCEHLLAVLRATRE